MLQWWTGGITNYILQIIRRISGNDCTDTQNQKKIKPGGRNGGQGTPE
jgi:hypothetical protein